MKRPGIFVRVRARLNTDERGFGLIETVIAITIIFASLVSLAYTATAGFKYMGFARQRQAATGIAVQIMEEARGLAYSKITSGLLSTDLSGDTNLVTSCAGDPAGTYRFQSCSGEKIVASPGLPNPTVPLVPHRGTISAGYNVPYSWSIYVTNNSPGTGPYRVTVLVSWTANYLSGLSHSVTTQSFFYSPSGCVNSSTHPFAAPCQPFFFGQAQLIPGSIDVSGSIRNLNWSDSTLSLQALESDAQNEQVSQVQGSLSLSGATMTTSSGTQSGGSEFFTTAADADPAGSTPSYGAIPPPPILGAGATLTTSSGGGDSISVTATPGDTGNSASAVYAGGTSVCRLPPNPSETDLQPCGYTSATQAGTLIATLVLGTPVSEGSALLTSIASSGSSATGFVDRQLDTPPADGRMQSTVSRALGQVLVANIPSQMTAPAGWAGYLVRVTGYQDSAQATAGTNSTVPTTSVAGTVSYWNPTTRQYVSQSIPGACLGAQTIAAFSYSYAVTPAYFSSTVNGHLVVIQITGSFRAGGCTTSQTFLSGATRTAAQASVSPPLNTDLFYKVFEDCDPQVTSGCSAVTSLELQVGVGGLLAKSNYQQAPVSG